MQFSKTAFSTLILLISLNLKLHAQTSRTLKQFPPSSPEQQGMSAPVLDSLLRFIRDTNQNIHHLTIIRNHSTVLDVDVYPYTSQYLHDQASVTKSFTSLLIGIAIDNGFIENEDVHVLKFFSELRLNNQRLDSMTIKDLLTMRSGFDCNVNDGERALTTMRASADWATFVLNLPITSKPGEKFSYCSCNTYLLAEIIYRATKMIPHDFAKKYLFGPLQITDSRWLSNQKGINHGWGDLFLHPADMTKVGQMVLDKGKWQGTQIVSAQWIEKSLKPLSNLGDDKGYGYGWWTNDKAGYYEAAGRGRQTISVIPSKNIVVTMLGGEFDAGAIGKYIFSAIKSDYPLPKDVHADDKLNQTVRELMAGPASKLESGGEDVIRRFHKRTIALEPNISEIDSLQIQFASNHNGDAFFYRKGVEEIHPFVVSAELYSTSIDPALKLPVALQVTLKNDNELVLHFNQLCRINNFYFHFTVTNNHLTTLLEETTNFFRMKVGSTFR